jgi:hypothetical protein
MYIFLYYLLVIVVYQSEGKTQMNMAVFYGFSHNILQVYTNVSEKHTASIFRRTEYGLGVC